VSYALNPAALYNRGFHPSAVCGTFGAAAAAGHLFRLPAPKFAVALGLGMQQACGLLAWASDHTENSAPLQPGLAARNGVTAAALARLGFGGPPAPFEASTMYSRPSPASGIPRPPGRLGEPVFSSRACLQALLELLLHPSGPRRPPRLARDHQLKSTHVQEILLRFRPPACT